MKVHFKSYDHAVKYGRKLAGSRTAVKILRGCYKDTLMQAKLIKAALHEAEGK